MNQPKPLLTFVMAATLFDYPGSASNKEEKTLRAIKSFIDQDTDHPIELVVIGDGASDENFATPTHHILGSPSRQIKFIYINKCPSFSGTPRNIGIENASADIIAYLDADDVIATFHARNILTHFTGAAWGYWNDCVALSPDIFNHSRMRGTNLGPGFIGTSCIVHKKSIGAKWSDGYGHDWNFVQQLMILEPTHKYIPNNSGYIVCHIAHSTTDY